MRDFSFYNNTLKHFLYNYQLAEFYTLHRLGNKNNFSPGVYRRIIMFCLSSDKTNQKIARDKIPHKYLKNVRCYSPTNFFPLLISQGLTPIGVDDG